ncbi:unnamed protein product, partial [Protopolystoma xenopodis]
TLEIQKESITPGANVVIVDDLVALGGTLIASAELIKAAGGNPICALCVIELLDLGGRKCLEEINVPLLSLLLGFARCLCFYFDDMLIIGHVDDF